MVRTGLVLTGALALLASSCAGDNGGDDRGDTTAVTVPDYSAEAAGFTDAVDDRSLPPVEPDGPVGAYGFSRYVYTQIGDDVVPTLVEGPRGQQHRCQELERLCSYLELQALYESGDAVPDYLGMNRAELGELVGQLDAVNAAIQEYPTLEEACAAGFVLSSSQNANMGIHVQNPNGTTLEFDPARPQMVLYAKDGGERFKQSEIGECADGAWTGEPGYESVGAVFTLLLSADHPEGFSGPIDNWHVHFNTCAGSPDEGGATDRGPAIGSESENRGTFTRQGCATAGGKFQEIIPVWMMHAYVEPRNDAQGGVFAMFNPSIWPLADTPGEIQELRTASLEGAINAPINNFAFRDITADTGEPIVFSNSDSVPHTVTAGTPAVPESAFDSGLLGTGDSFELSFDEPGEYALFCALHPAMAATVTVE